MSVYAGDPITSAHPKKNGGHDIESTEIGMESVRTADAKGGGADAVLVLELADIAVVRVHNVEAHLAVDRDPA